jgi:competence protein ComEC
LLCLLRSPLRWSSAVLVLIACAWAIRTQQPDVLVSADARLVGIRGTDGRLSILKSTGADTFAIRNWLAADADARAVSDPSLSAGTKCDQAGCIGRAGENKLIALPLLPEAFEEDCARAAIVVTARTAPPWCAALVIDRNVWRSSGAVTLQRAGNSFALTPTRPPGFDRPWARAVSAADSAASVRPNPTARPPLRDATPHSEDLEAGD